MPLFLRVLAVCATPDMAESIHTRMLGALAAWRPAVHAAPKPYWKVADQWEFTFLLAPPDAKALRTLQANSPAGWIETEADGEISCVWNRPPDGQFLVAEAVWAELSLHA